MLIQNKKQNHSIYWHNKTCENEKCKNNDDFIEKDNESNVLYSQTINQTIKSKSTIQLYHVYFLTWIN